MWQNYVAICIGVVGLTVMITAVIIANREGKRRRDEIIKDVKIGKITCVEPDTRKFTKVLK